MDRGAWWAAVHRVTESHSLETEQQQQQNIFRIFKKKDTNECIYKTQIYSQT